MLYRAREVRPPTIREEVFPAPTRGWMQAGNLVSAPADAAEVLDNFWVTSQGIKLRGGTQLFADMEAPAVRLFTYASGGSENLFGSTASNLYSLVGVGDILLAEDGATLLDEDGDELLDESSNYLQSIEGLASGDWSTIQLGNAAGQYLVAVNGADVAMYWDGSEWNPINGAAVNEVAFDNLVSEFVVGETVTGGTSGASATIVAIKRTSALSGILKLGAITSGPFDDDEELTSASGEATANGASASASSITITNVATSALSHVNLHKRRLWFVEKDTRSAWYLPADAIGGAAVEFDFGGVFKKGGNLLFTATWSLDSGNGLDDVFIAVSTQGEVAVYEGTDPGSASTWALTGVYQIGKPLNKHAYFAAGGDLAILTEDGIVPVSEALRKDRAALQANAISAPIEDAWKEAIANRTTEYPITATLWQKQSRLIIGTPSKDGGSPVAFAAYAQTGAWSRIVGWDIRCSVVYADELYYADNTGKVYRADVGGTDTGTEFSAVCVPKFSYSTVRRGAVTAGVTYKSQQAVDFDLYAHTDYKVDDMPPVPLAQSISTSTWGSGVWGTFIWGGDGNLKSFTEWQQVLGSGYAMTLGLKIACNQASAVNFEVVAMRLRSEQGYAL